MEQTSERRKEQRLRYHWPIWFAEDFNETLSQGQMFDISSESAGFTCPVDTNLYQGQHVTARFSVPRFGHGDSFDMANFTRSGRICRVDEVNQFLSRVAIRFAEPLPFKPGEQAEGDADAQKKLDAVMI